MHVSGGGLWGKQFNLRQDAEFPYIFPSAPPYPFLSIFHLISSYGFAPARSQAMMNSGFGDPPEEHSPSQPFEQSFLPAGVSNPESSTASDELFTCLISKSTDTHSNAGSQPKEFYQCRRCGRYFGRLDHVKRHCRSREFLVLRACNLYASL